MSDDLKEWALRYANMGLRVFPLQEGSKSKQVLRSWKNEATVDKETIQKWWDKNPKYNIGIATGNSLLVVDVDVKNGAEGQESFNTYGSSLPSTATVKTPSGGYHMYYWVKGEFKNKINLYEGIDIRSDNGYVLAPPSVINGKKYKWLSEDINDATETVYEFLKGIKDIEIEDVYNPPLELPKEIGEGSRNATLFQLASSLQAKGLSDKAILSAVWNENQAKCNPPLTKDEVKTIVHSALKYDKGTNIGKTNSRVNTNDLSVVNMSNVEEKEPEWLIQGFIPKGQITLIAGNGGVGKTTVWCNVVAAISSGGSCFFDVYDFIEDKPPQKVMYFSSEDDIQATLKGRLKRNGANMENIMTIPLEDPRFKEIKYNSQFLENLIAYHRPALVVFDPLQSFIPANVNMGYRNAMRDVLNPLIGYGMKYGVTVLIMAHTNKRDNAYGRNRIADSSDIWDIARSVFIVGFTGNDNMRYLSHEKSNYVIEQMTTIFSINDGVPQAWGTTNKKDYDYQNGKVRIDKKGTAFDEAKNFILNSLQEGGMEATELNELAKAMSISTGTFNRAKADLSKSNLIEIKRIGSPNGDTKRKTVICLKKIEELEENE